MLHLHSHSQQLVTIPMVAMKDRHNRHDNTSYYNEIDSITHDNAKALQPVMHGAGTTALRSL